MEMHISRATESNLIAVDISDQKPPPNRISIVTRYWTVGE
jgi:hypothetical protein